MEEKMPRRILLVEDEPDIQAIAKMSLESLGGYHVDVCNSGLEAVERAAALSPDLILLDVMMPRMDGPTTLRKLREQTTLSKTPIVFMTAKVQASELALYQKAGAIDVIAKPFDPMTLAEQVRRIWEAHLAGK